MIIDMDNSRGSDVYKLMAQTIIPRPIAWVVTEHNGVINVAPFSYFIALSSKPASVLVSVGHKSDGTPKDTLANIREHKKCTICMVDEKSLEKMHFSSKSLDKDLSEAEVFNIETEPFCDGYPPMVKGVPTAYCCDFNQEIDLGEGASSTIPLIMNVQKVYVDDAVITDKEKMSIDFDPVARIGRSYAFLGTKIPAPKIPE